MFLQCLLESTVLCIELLRHLLPTEPPGLLVLILSMNSNRHKLDQPEVSLWNLELCRVTLRLVRFVSMVTLHSWHIEIILESCWPGLQLSFTDIDQSSLLRVGFKGSLSFLRGPGRRCQPKGISCSPHPQQHAPHSSSVSFRVQCTSSTG